MTLTNVSMKLQYQNIINTVKITQALLQLQHI
jgi:hypothetical protein